MNAVQPICARAMSTSRVEARNRPSKVVFLSSDLRKRTDHRTICKYANDLNVLDLCFAPGTEMECFKHRSSARL